MLRLVLMRHAKSAWDNPALSDFERGLNERGCIAAPLMGTYLAEELKIEPDLILCSTARRTRETLAAILPLLRGEQEIRLLKALYTETEETYIGAIRANGGAANTLMLIGHNPAIQHTALDLTGQAPAPLHQALKAKYPTASLTVLEFTCDDWQDIHPEKGFLSRFIRPRDLAPLDTDLLPRIA